MQALKARADSSWTLTRVARFGVAVVLVAVGAALFAVAFRWSLAFVLRRALGGTDVVAAMTSMPFWARLSLPAVGGLVAGILSCIVARAPQGHGVGDVMEAVVLGRVRLSMRVTVLKSLASWFAIVTGGSIGREGPLIQFGGATGQLVARWTRLTDESGQLIAAGTAAGFAAAYNTPFAAVLFVLEIVTGMVVLNTVIPVLIAVVLATAVTRALVGDGPIYGQRTFHLHTPWELLTFVGLGVASALGAQGFMRLLSYGEDLFRKPWLPQPWRPALGGLLAGCIVAVLPAVAGNGYEPLNALLDGHSTLAFVALLVVGKSLATTASVSSGSPGGVFTPILLVGGSIGAAYARVVGYSDPTAVGGYALVGMAAATAASTHAPLMAAVMIFELSGDYAIALPLLLATALATVVSRKLRRESIYAAELRKKGLGWEITMAGRRVVKDAQ